VVASHTVNSTFYACLSKTKEIVAQEFPEPPFIGILHKERSYFLHGTSVTEFQTATFQKPPMAIASTMCSLLTFVTHLCNKRLKPSIHCVQLEENSTDSVAVE